MRSEWLKAKERAEKYGLETPEAPKVEELKEAEEKIAKAFGAVSALL